MKFVDVYSRFGQGTLSCAEASAILGVSLSTFFRMRTKYDAEGLEGLVDHRVGRLSEKRIPSDEAMKIIALYKTTYPDFTVKHFHEHLASMGITRSYTSVKTILQQANVVRKAPRRGAHRRKRERKPLPGMMLHQDGSKHEWVPGKLWDLIVTMDDATSEIYSMFFVPEEGTQSSMMGMYEVISKHGLPCSLYVDRGSHYFTTPIAGGKVDRVHTTQFGRAMKQLNIEMIPSYCPQGRGRSERMFGTLQKRLPQELRLKGITDMEEANTFLREEYMSKHNQQFAVKASEEGSAFVPYTGSSLEDILCTIDERRVGNDNTISFKNHKIQINQDKVRYHYAQMTVHVHTYLNNTVSVFYGPRRLSIELMENQEPDPPKQCSAPSSVMTEDHPHAASQVSALPCYALDWLPSGMVQLRHDDGSEAMAS